MTEKIQTLVNAVLFPEEKRENLNEEYMEKVDSEQKEMHGIVKMSEDKYSNGDSFGYKTIQPHVYMDENVTSDYSIDVSTIERDGVKHFILSHKNKLTYPLHVEIFKLRNTEYVKFNKVTLSYNVLTDIMYAKNNTEKKSKLTGDFRPNFTSFDTVLTLNSGTTITLLQCDIDLFNEAIKLIHKET